ncbi:MAG TPA: histidine kinase N-terminal domain-containing protein [Coriobacteriia bacterium]|nr:histidine kinase N-terminal domain-containing protein [Coriobacteriia bacterium]
MDERRRAHVSNVVENLQLIADLCYGNATLAVVSAKRALAVVGDARPSTAVAPVPASRIGRVLAREDEPEAYECISAGSPVRGSRTRTARGIKYVTSAFPIGASETYAVVVRDLAEQVAEAPGAMETAFMLAGEDLLASLGDGPLLDVRTGASFSARRTAGDGVLRVDDDGRISYASPNAVNIMRLAGHDGPVTGIAAPELPGGGFGIAPVLGTRQALDLVTEVADRSLHYRSIGLAQGALVLVQDVTESRRREAELKVKEATIREIHHRVKNNLQTIASLLRIQARRTDSEEARHALAEATERVGSMAVVHDLLAGSDEERVDFAEAARTVVNLVRRGLVGETSHLSVKVEGTSGEVDAHTATSLALAVAELVHNAIEHGLADASEGEVRVQLRRVPGELVLVVRDNGRGIPEGFDAAKSANLGLTIVRTVVEDDLGGTLSFSAGRGTNVTVRVPVADEE